MDPIFEAKLREIIREEIEKVVAELSAEKLREAKEGIPVTLGNPSFASMIPTDPFPELRAEDIRERIEELRREEGDFRTDLVDMQHGETMRDIYGMVWTRHITDEFKGWVAMNGNILLDTQEDLQVFKRIILGEEEEKYKPYLERGQHGPDI